MVGGAHTWPMQARLAAKGELTALEDLRRRIRVGIPQDDLTQIEGIGPQVQTALYAAGIQTYADLANVAPDLLRRVLDEAGLKSVHPETWPEQARLIVNNDLSGLADLQSRL
jgi:predicted flap endonuclease-1-like 5' DNA nuclease